MATPVPVPFFHVKYGFEATPERMYNANVSCAVLLSFVRTACVKDVDDFCKHKSVQLGVELDAIHKLLAARGVDLSALRASASRPPSGASRPTSGSASRPPSAASTSRKGGKHEPVAVGKPEVVVTFTPEQDPDGQLAVAVAKKSVFERQLEIVNAAARVVKELSARTAWVDLTDGNMTRLKLDEASDERASSLVALHGHYTVVAVSRNEAGEPQVTPLSFALPKYEPESL